MPVVSVWLELDLTNDRDRVPADRDRKVILPGTWRCKFDDDVVIGHAEIDRWKWPLTTHRLRGHDTARKNPFHGVTERQILTNRSSLFDSHVDLQRSLQQD